MAITKGSPVQFTAANDTEIPTYEPNFQLVEGSLGFLMVEANALAPRYGTSGIYCTFRDNVNSYTADQEATVKIVDASGAGPYGNALRVSGSGASVNLYRGTYSSGDGGRLDIWKVVAGAQTLLASVLSTPFANNDVLKFRVTGTAPAVLRLFKNASTTPLLSFTDSTSPHTTGTPAVTGRAGGGFEWAIDDWTPNDYSVAPTVSAPIGNATGNTTATVGFTTDQAVSGALPAYFLTLPAATAAPADAAALIADGATVSQTTGGTTPTRALTGLTTNTAFRTHMCQPGSNVVSSASYTPPTLASSGSLSAQTAVAGGGITWVGVTPDSQITNRGVGTGSWSIVSSPGFTVAPSINASTGVLSGGTADVAGTYAPQVRYTDSSTAGTNPTGGGSPPQTIDRTLSLTVSAAAGGPTINTHPTNQAAKIGATATFSASATASSGSLTAQWQKDAANISGANGTTSYARTGVVLADHGGAFRCGYSDAAGGPVYTNPATLTVAVTFINGPVPAQSGAVGVAASWDFSSYFAGGLSRTFAILSGAPPAGMSQVGSTAVFSGTPSAAGSGSMVVRATDSATNTDQTGTISWTISAALATTLSLTLTTDGTNPAANLTGLKVAVYDQPTPNLWAGQQPIYTTAAGTTNGSGVFTCSIAGLTTLAPGGIAGVAISNSDGTTTQGAAQRGYVGPVVVS